MFFLPCEPRILIKNLRYPPGEKNFAMVFYLFFPSTFHISLCPLPLSRFPRVRKMFSLNNVISVLRTFPSTELKVAHIIPEFSEERVSVIRLPDRFLGHKGIGGNKESCSQIRFKSAIKNFRI